MSSSKEWVARNNRAELLMSGVMKHHRIIEIGASFAPLAPKRDGWRTCVVDHDTRENLVAKYAGTDVKTEEIEEVDVVWRHGQLHKVVSRELIGTCDAIIVSHVLEHLPDLIGFLDSARQLVHDQGRLIFALPDKRWCFDLFRALSFAGDVLQAHHEQRLLRSFATRFNEIAYSVTAEGKIGWGAGEHVRSLDFFHPFNRLSKLTYDAAAEPGEYEDAHAWHFTPSSFALLVLDLSLIGVVDWQVEWMESGKRVEFFGHLRPGALCFQDQRASQAMRLKLLKDISRELAEQWQSISQADAVPKHMAQKGIARFFNRRSHR